MAFRRLPEQARLQQLFSYDVGSGTLTRLTAPARRNHIGDMVGSGHIRGYLSVSVDSVAYLLHRIIWKLVTGAEPEFMDHIDGVRTNNRFANLRSVSKKENCKNACRPANNKSGVVGVSWLPSHEKWLVQIGGHEEKHYVGLFDNFEQAVAARKKAEAERGYHPNHGRAPAVSYGKGACFPNKPTLNDHGH